MRNKQNSKKWILVMGILILFETRIGLADNQRTSSELSFHGKGATLSENSGNLYNLSNNENNSNLEIITASVDNSIFESANLKENITSENGTVLSILHSGGSLKNVYSNDDYPLHRGDMDVFDNYDAYSMNETIAYRKLAKQADVNDDEQGRDMIVSVNTISWLESFMYSYRNWQWVLFNTLFMVTWIFFGIFALYRLIGLYWCSLIFSRSLYLVLHLLIFTAATFSIVQLLHLSYGNHQGLPLFLTLLLTHTPSPCLALACCIVVRSILAAANIPMYRRYTASLIHVAIFSTVILFLSFVGDVAVGISHSNIILAVFRFVVNILCMLPLFLFIYKYLKIRKIHKSLQREFVRELKSLVPSQQGDNRDDGIDSRSTLRAILNPWAQLTVISASCGVIMLSCNFSISLFFTIPEVSLALFWVLHSMLFISQIIIVVSITAGATLTLSNVTQRNINLRYFIIPLPKGETNTGSYVQHGNFIYQRVSVSNLANGGLPHTNNFISEHNGTTQNNIAVCNIVERPKVNVRRSATFNCPPCPVYIHSPPQDPTNVHPVFSDHLLCTYPIDERDIVSNHNCALQCINKNYNRKNNIMLYSKPVSDTEDYSFSSGGKFPVMGCNGKSRYGSLHSLPNISPRIRTHPTAIQCCTVNEAEPFIRSIPENYVDHNASVIDNNIQELPTGSNQTGNYVKDIIMENQNLFRSHSLRQSSLRRKIRNRERVSIRTVPSQNISLTKASCSPIDLTKIEVTESNTVTSPVNFIPSKYYNETGDSTLQSKSFNDSYYNDTEKSNMYYRNNSSESNSIHKMDARTYESHEFCKDIELCNRAPLKVGENDMNIQFNPQHLVENSAKSDISAYDTGGKYTSYVKNCDADKVYNSKEEETCGDKFDSTPHSSGIVSDEFTAFTLPLQKRTSKNRNNSSTLFETKNIPLAEISHDPVMDKNTNYSNNWYGTWAGRKSKRRNIQTNDGSSFHANMRKLSGSKSSLSNLYEKLKTRKYKSSMTSIDTLDVDEVYEKTNALENELVILENNDESDDETLPKISENIDLASEILKSSSMLADFLVSKDSDEVQEYNSKSLEEPSLESSIFEIKA